MVTILCVSVTMTLSCNSPLLSHLNCLRRLVFTIPRDRCYNAGLSYRWTYRSKQIGLNPGEQGCRHYHKPRFHYNENKVTSLLHVLYCLTVCHCNESEMLQIAHVEYVFPPKSLNEIYAHMKQLFLFILKQGK